MLLNASFTFEIKDQNYTAVYNPRAKSWNVYLPMKGFTVKEDRTNQVVSKTRALQQIKKCIEQDKITQNRGLKK